MPPRPRSDRRNPRPDTPRPADGGGGAPATSGGSSAAADDVRRFAELLRAQEAKKKADAAESKRRADAERARVEAEQAGERRLAGARTAKEQAARRLKDVRARGASNAVVAEAEAAYKVALADLLAEEQGERPSWAPALPEPEPEVAEASDAEASDAEPEASADAAPEAEAPTD